MSPVIMFSENSYSDDPGEYDECTFCGHVTTLLVWCRMDQQLAGLCGNCIDALKAGYAEMMKRRLVHRAAYGDDAS